MGRNWLVALRYKITQPIERGECKVNAKAVNCDKLMGEISPKEKRSPEIRQLEGEFLKLIKRKGRVKNYEIKLTMIKNAKTTKQKGRRIPI